MAPTAGICVVMPEDGNQQDLDDFTPAGFSLDFQLTPVPPGEATVSMLWRMAEDREIEDAALLGARQQPACISYACTAASFVRGKGGDEDINRRITAVTGIPATSSPLAPGFIAAIASSSAVKQASAVLCTLSLGEPSTAVRMMGPL